MTKKILLVCFFVWTILQYQVSASASSSQDQLNGMVDKALGFAKQGNYEESKRMLDYFSKQFSGAGAAGSLYTLDDMRIITGAFEEADKMIINPDAPAGERIKALTKLRLVLDAASHSNNPLWTALEGQVMSVFAETKTAAADKNLEVLGDSIDQLLSLYNMMYPSLKVDITPETIQQLDAHMTYLTLYKPDLLNGNGIKELDEIEQEFQTVFEESSEDETDPSLWWVIFTTGSIIILTLSYVGWRKYLGGRQGKTRKEHDD